MSLEDRIYCIEGVLSLELVSLEDRFYCIERVPPLIRVSLIDRFYCIEGVRSSECPLKTGFTVYRVSSYQSVP